MTSKERAPTYRLDLIRRLWEAQCDDLPEPVKRTMAEAATMLETNTPETRVAPALPMRMDEPWSLPEVLAKLIEATEHSLNVHSCDNHGHELYRSAVIAGRSILHEWQNTAPHPQARDGKETAVSARRCHCGQFALQPGIALITDDHAHDHVFDGTSCDCEDGGCELAPNGE